MAATKGSPPSDGGEVNPDEGGIDGVVNQPLRLKLLPIGRLTTPASQSLGHPSFKKEGSRFSPSNVTLRYICIGAVLSLLLPERHYP